MIVGYWLLGTGYWVLGTGYEVIDWALIRLQQGSNLGHNYEHE